MLCGSKPGHKKTTKKHFRWITDTKPGIWYEQMWWNTMPRKQNSATNKDETYRVGVDVEETQKKVQIREAVTPIAIFTSHMRHFCAVFHALLFWAFDRIDRVLRCSVRKANATTMSRPTKGLRMRNFSIRIPHNTDAILNKALDDVDDNGICAQHDWKNNGKQAHKVLLLPLATQQQRL